MEEWKTIQEYPNYEFSSQNRVRNKTTNKFLTLDKKNRFQLCKEGKRTKTVLSKLKHKYFPEPIIYLPGEIFLIIDGFPNYEISNKGRVYNNEKGTFFTQFIGTTGYYYISFWKNNKGKHFKIHRLVAKAFIPNPKNFPEVDHIDRNKLNNNVENLRWVNSSENKINTLQIREYPKHINKYKKNNGKYWRIQIYHPNFKFHKGYNCKKYTLEEVVEIRNEKYKEGKIEQLDGFTEVYE